MKQTLAKQQSLGLAMTPQLQQGIRLLQLPTLDLVEELHHLQDQNPMLEVVEREGPESEPGNTQSPDLDTVLSQRTSRGMKRRSVQTRRSLGKWPGCPKGADFGLPLPVRESEQGADSIPESPLSLRESLRNQALFLALGTEQQRAADHIIENINAAGYLEAPLEEVHAALGGVVPLADIECILGMIQQLEPAGVAARTLQECLGLQLGFLDDSVAGKQVARRIVEKCLPCLAEKDYRGIRNRLGLSVEAVADGVGLIRQLDPRPGYRVGDGDIHYIVPDVLVYRRGECWVAGLNLESLPEVSINQEYQQLVEEGRGPEYKALKEQLQQARWLVNSVEKRYRTILDVARKIVEYQQDYFFFGPRKIRPMTLSDVADPLGIHESTVSRVVNNKYLSGPTGIRELRYFFPSRIVNVLGNADSSLAVKAEIRRIIENEDSTLPATDSQICLRLRNKGYRIARRTVAKYRAQIRVPPAAKRTSSTPGPRLSGLNQA